MDKRAERLAAGLADVRVHDKVAKLRFPTPVAVRPDAAHRRGAVEELRLAGDLHRRRPRRGQGHAGRRPRAQRRRQDDAAAHAGRHRDPRHRRGEGRATGCGWATTRRSTRRSTWTARCSRSCARRRRTAPTPSCGGSSAPSSSPARPSTSGPARSPAASAPGWRWPRWSSPAPTCCCSTSRPTTSTRPAASRCSRRCAPTPARSCWSPTTRARSQALNPDKVILLPDGTEDTWSEDFADLVVARLIGASRAAWPMVDPGYRGSTVPTPGWVIMCRDAVVTQDGGAQWTDCQHRGRHGRARPALTWAGG